MILKKETVARMRPLERKALLERIAAMVSSGELRLGEAARVLRSAVLGMDRATFARAVHLSERAIAKLEDEPDGNPTLETLQQVFGPFGGRIGLVFPTLEDPGPGSVEDEVRSEAIRSALQKNQRRRKRT